MDDASRKYVVIRNALDGQACELVRNSMTITKDAHYFVKKVPFTDVNYFADSQPVGSNCYAIYSAVVNEGLLLTLLPQIERAWGTELYPTYSFARIYWHGASMVKHTDRPACEFSASLCISVDGDPWPIWVDGEELTLQPGDLVTYKGLEVEHWREPYEGHQQIQVFLHYVDKHGPHAGQKYDKRPMLGLQTQRGG